MQQFDKFEATFQPQRTDDLKPGVAEWVGRRFTWEASYLVGDPECDDPEYFGDWSCTLVDPAYEPGHPPPFAWAYQRDLVDIANVQSLAERHR